LANRGDGGRAVLSPVRLQISEKGFAKFIAGALRLALRIAGHAGHELAFVVPGIPCTFRIGGLGSLFQFSSQKVCDDIGWRIAGEHLEVALRLYLLQPFVRLLGFTWG